MTIDTTELLATLGRIANALDRLAPLTTAAVDFEAADAFVWHAASCGFTPVPKVNRVDIGLLRGIDLVRDLLVENTERFSRGLPANNALLWGARGMGKSSLVKAVHAQINAAGAGTADFRPMKLVEIHREDIETLPALMSRVRPAPYPFILFCDDLSFDAEDTSYKSLKAVLEGGIDTYKAEAVQQQLMAMDSGNSDRGAMLNRAREELEASRRVEKLQQQQGFPRPVSAGGT